MTETVKRIHPQDLYESWVHVAENLAPVLVGSEFTLDDILERLCCGHAQLWCCYDPEDTSRGCYIISELQIRQIGLVAVLRFAAGRDVISWLPLLDHLFFQWALAEGAKKIEIWGRKGWGRHLRARGVEEEYTVFSLTIPENRIH